MTETIKYVLEGVPATYTGIEPFYSATPAPSPFIEGTKLQFAWDSTSLGLLKECPRKYQYTIIEGWRGRNASVHLDFGGWYHSALELYDRLRVDGVTTHDTALEIVVQRVLEWTWIRTTCPTCEGKGGIGHEACTDCYGRGEIDGEPWESDHNTKTRGTLLRSVVWYLDQYRDDPAKTMILANGKPAVELSFRMNIDVYPEGFRGSGFLDPYILCGHLDRVVEFSGSNYVMDRKTTGTTISPYFFESFSPDNQMSLYTFAAQTITQAPIKGVIIDGAQIAVGFTRFDRGFTYRTQGQLDEWFRDTVAYLRAAEDYARAEYWPTNDKSCGNYGGCVFRGICSKDPGVRRQFLESNFTTRFWNPLEVR